MYKIKLQIDKNNRLLYGYSTAWVPENTNDITLRESEEKYFYVDGIAEPYPPLTNDEGCHLYYYDAENNRIVNATEKQLTDEKAVFDAIKAEEEAKVALEEETKQAENSIDKLTLLEMIATLEERISELENK